MLACAAARRPCLVLTNGTAPLLQRLAQLEPLRQCAHPVAFRVSIDYRERHELGRGAGTFAEAWRALGALHDLGFGISLARQRQPTGDSGAIDAQFLGLLASHGLPTDLRIVAFPDFLPPGSASNHPEISSHCMATCAAGQANFMCAFNRMRVKQRGRMRVYACTLVDDDPD